MPELPKPHLGRLPCHSTATSGPPKKPPSHVPKKAVGRARFEVMTMLQQLVDDAAAMEAEAVRAEKSGEP